MCEKKVASRQGLPVVVHQRNLKLEIVMTLISDEKPAFILDNKQSPGSIVVVDGEEEGNAERQNHLKINMINIDDKQSITFI